MFEFCSWFFKHLSSFCLCLSSVADFSNTGVRAPTSAECAPFLPMQRAMQFGHMVWVRVMIIFRWLYFYFINRRHPYRWVAVVSWLNYLILGVDLWGSSAQYRVKRAIDLMLGSSTLLHIHHSASHDLWGLVQLSIS